MSSFFTGPTGRIRLRTSRSVAGRAPGRGGRVGRPRIGPEVTPKPRPTQPLFLLVPPFLLLLLAAVLGPPLGTLAVTRVAGIFQFSARTSVVKAERVAP